MNFKKLVLKTIFVIAWVTIKIEDFDFNPLLNGKLHQNILIRDVL